MRHTLRSVAALPALAAVALALGGCLGSTTPVPADHYYRFMVPAPGEAASERVFDGVLSVAVLETDGLLRDRPILFTTHRDPLTLRQHNYHLWADPPARLIQREMIRYLRAAGIAVDVVAPGFDVRADYELIGRIQRLERVLGGTPSVVASIQIVVRRARDRRVLIEKTYDVDLRAGNDAVNAAVSALNAGLGRIFARFRDDAVQTRQTVRR